MMTRRTALTAAAVGSLTLLGGCAAGGDDGPQSSGHEGHEGHGGEDGHGAHDHPTDGGPVPEGMTPSAAPAHPVGSEVVLRADHMPGMEGAAATIVGAYDTWTYAVDLRPTTGGEEIRDHRWVVQEELEGVGEDRLPDGTEVTLLADHMPGMQGASATIASSTDETVYVVDLVIDGMEMTNHKWVVDSEIEPGS